MTAAATPAPSSSGLWLVYDGDCPFCAATAHMYRLKQVMGVLHVLDARRDRNHPLVEEVRQHGFDLNQGIAAKYQDRLYHGADALHLLALLGSRHGWLNRLNAGLFSNRTTAAVAYPVLKGVRNLLLTLLGRQSL